MQTKRGKHTTLEELRLGSRALLAGLVMAVLCVIKIAVHPVYAQAEDFVVEQVETNIDPVLTPQSQDIPILVEQAQNTTAMWRLYNPNSGEHFYTANLGEAKIVCKAGWSWEGVGWMAPSSGDPVYRLYNPNAGDHHYTLSAGERDVLVSLGWRYEGVGWYSDKNKTIAVLRQYNPNARTGTHNFTVNGNEKNMLVRAGWKDEGIGWYAAGLPQVSLTPFWLEGPSGDKAYIQANATRATGLFSVDNKTYYGREDSGWVVRGAYITPQKTIVRADRTSGIVKTGSLSGNARLDSIIDNLILTRIGTGPDALRRA